jgi:hypothetical protein
MHIATARPASGGQQPVKHLSPVPDIRSTNTTPAGEKCDVEPAAELSPLSPFAEKSGEHLTFDASERDSRARMTRAAARKGVLDVGSKKHQHRKRPRIVTKEKYKDFIEVDVQGSLLDRGWQWVTLPQPMQLETSKTSALARPNVCKKGAKLAFADGRGCPCQDKDYFLQDDVQNNPCALEVLRTEETENYDSDCSEYRDRETLQWEAIEEDLVQQNFRSLRERQIRNRVSDYSFSEVFQFVKARGWKYTASRDLRSAWIYMRPGVKRVKGNRRAFCYEADASKPCLEGVDFCLGEEALMKLVDDDPKLKARLHLACAGLRARGGESGETSEKISADRDCDYDGQLNMFRLKKPVEGAATRFAESPDSAAADESFSAIAPGAQAYFDMQSTRRRRSSGKAHSNGGQRRRVRGNRYSALASADAAEDGMLPGAKTPKEKEDCSEPYQPVPVQRAVEALQEHGQSDSVKLRRLELATQFPHWKSILLLGYSIGLYGLGSKRSLLEDFANRELDRVACDAMILRVNAFEGLSVRSIITELCNQALCPAATERACMPSDVDFARAVIRAYEHAVREGRDESIPERIFLVVHNIDAECLRSEEAQKALGVFASSPFIHLIASVDHVNHRLLWDRHLAEVVFNWHWVHAPTRDNYIDELPYWAAKDKSGERGAAGTQFVLESLSGKHIIIAKALAKALLKLGDKVPAKERGLELRELFAQCRTKAFVVSEQDLTPFLKDMASHSLVSMKSTSRGLWVSMPLSLEVLRFIEYFDFIS